LLVSQALTLFTTPVVYLYLDRVNHWLSHLRRNKDHQDAKDKAAVPAIVAGE